MSETETSMNRLFPALAILFGVPVIAAACLWDRDTPSSEALGMPEVVAAITGRFERNPPLFYEMRLNRVAEHIQEYPDDLDAYDDAGVASDRLGRGDEAIRWMKKKQERLALRATDDPESKEHTYRYHANLGTFLVHRWAKQGGDRAKISEVKEARAEIAKALEINPDAHFGREKYQLMALDWIIDPPAPDSGQYLPNLLKMTPQFSVRPDEAKEADDAVRGLSGLIMLGNAWESIDVFYALNIALQNDTVGFEPGANAGRNSLAMLAWMRACELVDAGKKSMLPGAPQGDDLKSQLKRPDFLGHDLHKDDFLRLRQDADQWQSARTAFMQERLEKGLHPDTDETFWSGYVERPAPELPALSIPEIYNANYARRMETAEMIFGGILALIMMAFSTLFFWYVRAVYRSFGGM
jgi:tetratricopeptide (TPR) repeat protein